MIRGAIEGEFEKIVAMLQAIEEFGDLRLSEGINEGERSDCRGGFDEKFR